MWLRTYPVYAKQTVPEEQTLISPHAVHTHALQLLNTPRIDGQRQHRELLMRHPTIGHDPRPGLNIISCNEALSTTRPKSIVDTFQTQDIRSRNLHNLLALHDTLWRDSPDRHMTSFVSKEDLAWL